MHVTMKGEQCRFRANNQYNGGHYCGKHLCVVKSTEDCAVCLSEMRTSASRIRLSCGHYFHIGCLSQVTKAECPLCRKQFDPRESMKVFDRTVVKPIFEEIFENDISTQSVVINVVRSVVRLSRSFSSYYVSSVQYVCELIESGVSTVSDDNLGSVLVMISNAFRYIKDHGSLEGFQVSYVNNQLYVN